MSSSLSSKFVAYRTLVFATLIFLSFSCTKAPLTNGEVVTEMRQLDNFDIINLYDNIDVTLINSDVFKIEITTGENLVTNIIADVIEGKLYLRNENTCNWIRSYDCPLEAKIYFSGKLSAINYESVGNLYSDSYIVDDSISRFDLNIEDGSGDIKLKINCDCFYMESHSGTNAVSIIGKSRYCYIYQNGLGPILAENFITDKADVYSYKSNDIYVQCRNNLKASIYNMGNIYYKGQPKIDSYIAPDALGRIIAF